MWRGRVSTRRLSQAPAPRAMLAAMRKRKLPEPFQPTSEPTWLVVRNQLSQVVESTALAPYTDLRAVLTAARQDRIAAGWAAEEIGQCCRFFFCTRESERLLVSIEARRPPPVGERW